MTPLLSPSLLSHSWYILRIRVNLGLCNWVMLSCLKLIECNMIVIGVTIKVHSHLVLKTILPRVLFMNSNIYVD